MNWKFLVMVAGVFLLVFEQPLFGQARNEPNPYEGVSSTIEDFVRAADDSDVVALEVVTHPAFRVAINQFQGSADVIVLDRPTYLQMVRDKKLGGQPRQLQIQSIEVRDHLAFADVRTESAAMIIDSYYVLMRDPDGKWWITSDVPYLTLK